MLLLFMCCYSLKDLILPQYIISCRSWESLRINNLRIHSSKFYFLILLFLYFILFYLVCGVGLVMNYFGNNINPLKNIFDNFIYAYLSYSILSLFDYKFFGSFLIMHRSFVIFLHKHIIITSHNNILCFFSFLFHLAL
jgi:hypothetical protein